jgi:hypothetical protein
MGKYNHKGPYFLVPIPYVPEDDKEADPSDGKPPSVKLLLDSEGKKVDNPTVQVQPIFNGGTTEQFFKWFQSLSSLLEEKIVGEHFSFALQALQQTDKPLWKRGMDLVSLKLAESAGLSLEASEKTMVLYYFEANHPCIKRSTSWMQASQIHGALPMDWQEYRCSSIYGSS